MKFEGIYTPVITPYREDFSIDYDRLAEIVDFLIDGGVHGLISAGTTGEYYAQTMQERVDLMKFIKQRIKGRVSLTVGTGAIRTEDSIEYAKAAVEIGADAIMIATPPYAIPTEREMHCMPWRSIESRIYPLFCTTFRIGWVRIWVKSISIGLGVHPTSVRSKKARGILTACTC